MHKIDAPGATVGNLFTEGNPALGVPATEVSDDWLNDVQQELVTIIENQGIVLNKGTQDQLEAAIKLMIGLGGDAQINQGIDQVQAVKTDVAGLIFDKTKTKAAHILVDINRQSDDSNVQEIGSVYVTHDTKDDVWKITKATFLDAAGVTLTITPATGQVQYVSANHAGANYAGQLRIAQSLKTKL